MSDALDRLVRESRPELGTREAQEVDWNKVDERLFRRIEAERRAERASLAPPASGGGRWAVVAGGLAAAAAIAVMVGKAAHDGRESQSSQTVADESAGNVVSVEGGGQLLVDGKPATAGAALRLGDVVEARGAQATLERPGKLTLVFERGTRATVTHVQGALVLALEEGAVEAQVVPVPSGEAFAVDVGKARVAVHGTHLRVARAGEHVVVDLSEGVVSLGDAPRVGSTLGALVTAPAHAEFSAGEAESTLSLTHDPASVRTPASIGTTAQARLSLPAVAAGPASPRVEPGEAHPVSGVATAPPRAEGHPAQGAASPRTATPVDLHPEDTIASAVRTCIAERPPLENVTLVVSTTVRLDVDADGTVLHARFDPPVAQDVNVCASGTIYRTRFAHGGSVAIPVDVRVPSSAP
jgi:ferric-dicitrate binding protein FerR (iron transport regulator)